MWVKPKRNKLFPDRNVGTAQSPSNEFLKACVSCGPRIRKGKEFQRREKVLSRSLCMLDLE